MAFAKDSAGFVHLKGTITAGTFAAAVFTLPVGYRPAQNLALPIAIQRSADIFTTGAVEVFQSGAETNARFDGIVIERRRPAPLAWRGPESNRRHHGFQPCALPTELPRLAREV
jgi:hypothetical protein